MDKYSLKIKKITNNILIKNININKSIFINKLYEITKNTYKSDMNIPKYISLNEIHTRFF